MNTGKFWTRSTPATGSPSYELMDGYVVRKSGYRYGIMSWVTDGYKEYNAVDLRTGYTVASGSTIHEAVRMINVEPTADLADLYKDDMAEMWVHMIDNPRDDVVTPIY